MSLDPVLLARFNASMKDESRYYSLLYSMLSVYGWEIYGIEVRHHNTSYTQVAEMEVQASRVVSLMDDLKRIVPEVELQMGPLLKVTVFCLAADNKERSDQRMDLQHCMHTTPIAPRLPL